MSWVKLDDQFPTGNFHLVNSLKALQNPDGRPVKTVSSRNGSRPAGTSRGYALRKLRKDAPELHAQVLAGDLTAHAAMLKAGFRRKTFTVPVDRPERIARTLRRQLDADTCTAVAELLRSPPADD